MPRRYGPGARNTDPDTSHAAADEHPLLRARDRIRVLITHYEHPDGLTDFELGDLVGRQQTSAGKRRGELRDDGLIEDSGFKRPAPSGSMAIVWRITPAGMALARLLIEPDQGLPGEMPALVPFASFHGDDE